MRSLFLDYFISLKFLWYMFSLYLYSKTDYSHTLALILPDELLNQVIFIKILLK